MTEQDAIELPKNTYLDRCLLLLRYWASPQLYVDLAFEFMLPRPRNLLDGLGI